MSKKSRNHSRLPGVIAREQQVALRARIVLAAAQGSSHVQIARDLHVNIDTVRLGRDRWAGWQGIDLETLSVSKRLQDAHRPGVAPTFTPEQHCQMATVARRGLRRGFAAMHAHP